MDIALIEKHSSICGPYPFKRVGSIQVVGDAQYPRQWWPVTSKGNQMSVKLFGPTTLKELGMGYWWCAIFLGSGEGQPTQTTPNNAFGSVRRFTTVRTEVHHCWRHCAEIYFRIRSWCLGTTCGWTLSVTASQTSKASTYLTPHRLRVRLCHLWHLTNCWKGFDTSLRAGYKGFDISNTSLSVSKTLTSISPHYLLARPWHHFHRIVC